MDPPRTNRIPSTIENYLPEKWRETQDEEARPEIDGIVAKIAELKK